MPSELASNSLLLFHLKPSASAQHSAVREGEEEEERFFRDLTGPPWGEESGRMRGCQGSAS